MPKTEKSKSLLTVGETVLIRTVTYFLTGRIEEVGDHEVTLSDAAWIADTGRFQAALQSGEGALAEVEPIPDGVATIGRGAIVDCFRWKHALPRSVK